MRLPIFHSSKHFLHITLCLLIKDSPQLFIAKIDILSPVLSVNFFRHKDAVISVFESHNLEFL